MTDQRKLEKYKAGEYIWPKPYPYTGQWNIWDKIRFIDLNNSWIGE